MCCFWFICIVITLQVWTHFNWNMIHSCGVCRLQLHGRSACLHIKLFLIDLHSNILQQFTYKPCIFVHYFKITWVFIIIFFKFPCFLCVGLNLRHNAYTCRYSLCRSKCRQEHEAFIDTTTSSPFEFCVVYSRTKHVYCIEC